MAAKQDDSLPDASLLQRRARRRLIGAIALMLLAVVVLPLIFDQEPRPIGQDLVIHIPSQDAGKFAPRAAPAQTEAKSEVRREDASAEPVKPEPPSPSPAAASPTAPGKAGGKGVTTAKAESARSEAAKELEKSEPAKAGLAPSDAAPRAESAKPAVGEAKRAQAILEGGAWLVPLGAYLNTANVKTVQTRATAAGFASFSEKLETAKGEQIRVRAGPFASRAEAERARDALKAAGLPADNPIKRQ